MAVIEFLLAVEFFFTLLVVRQTKSTNLFFCFVLCKWGTI